MEKKRAGAASVKGVDLIFAIYKVRNNPFEIPGLADSFPCSYFICSQIYLKERIGSK